MRWSTAGSLGSSLALVAGCAAAPVPAASSAPGAAAGDGAVPPQDAAVVDTKGGAGDDGADDSNSPARVGDGPRPTAAEHDPVLARDSAPAGLHLLSEAEQRQLESSCAKLVRWARTRAGRVATRRGATRKLLEVLAGVPDMTGVDVPACRDLLSRQLRLYLARTQEVEAFTTLKMLMLAMASAVERTGKLCPSAPPVPGALAAVKTTPYTPRSADWQSAGWRCLAHAGTEPQRFQYEVKSDPAAGHFDILARGFPVQGGASTELLLRGKLVDGKVELTSDIYRR